MSDIVCLQRVIEAAATAPGNCGRQLEIGGLNKTFVDWGNKALCIIESN